MLETVSMAAYVLSAAMGDGAHHRLELKSPSFLSYQSIPAQYTCQGKDESIPLYWKNVPKKTTSFVLIMEDPDATNGSFVHWVMYNLPRQMTRLPAQTLPDLAKHYKASYALNSWNKARYNGPCPMKGKHRYIISLYALDIRLHFGDKAVTASQVEDALYGHVLDTATLMGDFNAANVSR